LFDESLNVLYFGRRFTDVYHSSIYSIITKKTRCVIS
jgi:hypothetical protein